MTVLQGHAYFLNWEQYTAPNFLKLNKEKWPIGRAAGLLDPLPEVKTILTTVFPNGNNSP